MKNLFRCLFVICVFSVAGVTAQTTLDFARTINFGAMGTVKDMAIQPDNKIILFSTCYHINLNSVGFCGVRLNEDGSFDPTFTSNTPGAGLGIFTTNSNGGVSDVEVQSDGKVVAVGYGAGAVLIRYNADGSLDPTFGSGGMVLTIFEGPATAKKAAIQPDGKIVIVGAAPGGQLVARYMPDGTLDNSFGTGGIVQTGPSTDPFLNGVSVALQQDGKIVVGGRMTESATASAWYTVTRYDPDGSFDTTWDGDGIKSIAYNPAGGNGNGFADAGIRAVAVTLDGHVVALGHKNTLFRFNADGSADTAFDGDGERQALNGTNKDPYSLTVSAGGRITVVGATNGHVSCPGSPFPCPSPELKYLVARYNPDGTPDTTLDNDGYYDINIAGAATGAIAVALDGNGRTVVSGIAAMMSQPLNPWQTPMLSAVRISAPPSIGPVSLSGRVTRPDGAPVGSAVLILQSGSTVMTALTSPFGYYSFANVPSGQVYAISPGSKKVMFDDRSVFVDRQITAFNITSEPSAEARLSPVKVGRLIK